MFDPSGAGLYGNVTGGSPQPPVTLYGKANKFWNFGKEALMITRNFLDTDLVLLETTLYRTVAALSEAVVRQAAAENRGPANNPNSEAWESHIQELHESLTVCLLRLDDALASIAWTDPPLPRNPEFWPEWWAAIRRYVARNSTPFASLSERSLAE
jgi:hypothetical protein